LKNWQQNTVLRYAKKARIISQIGRLFNIHYAQLDVWKIRGLMSLYSVGLLAVIAYRLLGYGDVTGLHLRA
ncbi:hypothetical protein LHL20_20580, partial [Alteromonas sp. McT4-15]|uniref:hypothetical protein n=1 Tax=Alteromonas sp. McT4-15 TaxID=2881256 RepID=UPI001CF82FAB